MEMPYNMDQPEQNAADIRAAVNASRAFAADLFDQLRRDGTDVPGVSRDTYGPGEQRAHLTCTKVAERMGSLAGADVALDEGSELSEAGPPWTRYQAYQDPASPSRVR